MRLLRTRIIELISGLVLYLLLRNISSQGRRRRERKSRFPRSITVSATCLSDRLFFNAHFNTVRRRS